MGHNDLFDTVGKIVSIVALVAISCFGFLGSAAAIKYLVGV